VERMHERFLRSVLGMERRISGYLIKEELQREIIKSRAREYRDLKKGE